MHRPSFDARDLLPHGCCFQRRHVQRPVLSRQTAPMGPAALGLLTFARC
jgi:hypothetical protein